MTAFFGFGATPSRRHGSLFARARSPLVPLCVAPCVCAIAPGGRPFRCPGDVGPEGRLPFVARVFRACAKPVTGPVLRHSRHVPQHTMPGSGRAPGPPAGPGSFFGHCGKNLGVSLLRKLLWSSSSGDLLTCLQPGRGVPTMWIDCTAASQAMAGEVGSVTTTDRPRKRSNGRTPSFPRPMIFPPTTLPRPKRHFLLSYGIPDQSTRPC